ncbi:MAG: type II toxin-antitoxin system Phd/YefM family antitoxin [Planctomycetota bacterium]
MKVVSLSKVKARLSAYARICHKEPVIVTVNGAPAFEMVPLDGEDDLINQLIAHNPKFRELLRRSLSSKSMSMAEARRRL